MTRQPETPRRALVTYALALILAVTAGWMLIVSGDRETRPSGSLSSPSTCCAAIALALPPLA